VTHLSVTAPDGIGEITEGTDLAGVVLEALDLLDGDIVVITSKVVSKAEGRVLPGTDRDAAITAESVRVVARRGPVRIVENRLGLVMAAAGVDASNLARGTIALLPEDPDASARRIREAVASRAGRNVAVIVSDTSGRAWRMGQTDIAIGVAGIEALESFAGAADGYGNDLAVTEPAVADEIAGAAELASGKLGGRPLTVVRGLADRVLPAGEHGRGARVVNRPREADMFALGAREAVVAALAGDGTCFGTTAPKADLLLALAAIGLDEADISVSGARVEVHTTDAVTASRIGLVALAHGWVADVVGGSVVLRGSGGA